MRSIGVDRTKGVEVVGEPLRREKFEAGKSTVVGNGQFDRDGKLVGPKKSAQRRNSKKKQLPNVEGYGELCNVNYIQNEQARGEVIEVIGALQKIDGIVLRKVSGHDLSVKMRGRQILKICPLRDRWSASVNGSKIQGYTVKQVLDAVNEAVKEMQKKPIIKTAVETKEDSRITGKKAIKMLEEKVAGLSKTSIGFQIPRNVRVDKEVKQWAKRNGYTLTADKIMLNRIA